MSFPVRQAFVDRSGLPGALDGRLFFAQVREDPLLEIAGLADRPEGALAVVGSAGCTALSLIATGADRVFAVDLNRTQNHLSELKAVAAAEAAAGEVTAGEAGGGEAAGGVDARGVSAGGVDARSVDAVAFLGGVPAPADQRQQTYARLRDRLTPAARAHWDARPGVLAKGVLHSGASERLITAVAATVRRLAEPPKRIAAMAQCATLADQQRLYQEEWDNRRWRAIFLTLCNRMVLRRTYTPAFFEHVDNPSFGRHFLRTMEIALTELPVRDNYFFQDMFFGSYLTPLGGSLPPYLQPRNAAAMATATDRLSLVDGGYVEFLRSRPDNDLAGFALSNICEWLTPEQVDELFTEIVRTAKPGAKLVFRNFLGWTEVPQPWRAAVVEDRDLGTGLIRQDRSMLQRRIAICTIAK